MANVGTLRATGSKQVPPQQVIAITGEVGFQLKVGRSKVCPVPPYKPHLTPLTP
jgi:hypothetical protein